MKRIWFWCFSEWVRLRAHEFFFADSVPANVCLIPARESFARVLANPATGKKQAVLLSLPFMLPHQAWFGVLMLDKFYLTEESIELIRKRKIPFNPKIRMELLVFLTEILEFHESLKK